MNPRDPEFRLDFLTTLHRGVDEPYLHPRLHVVLQPLRFMEFLLEEVEQGVLFAGEVSVVVNLPNPARYALHKLLVAAERRGAFQAKAAKDLVQAGMLLAVLRERRGAELQALWQNLLGRGPGLLQSTPNWISPWHLNARWFSRERTGQVCRGASEQVRQQYRLRCVAMRT